MVGTRGVNHEKWKNPRRAAGIFFGKTKSWKCPGGWGMGRDGRSSTAGLLPSMKTFSAFSLLAASALGLIPLNASAQSAVTEPVGAITLTPLPNADTIMSVPLNRPAVFKGTVASVAGSRVQVQGTPNWTTNQFVYAAGNQTNTYYLAITGNGTKSGMFYTITANDANGVTVDTAGDTITGIAANTEVRIIPYWTFGTLFPSGTGVTASTSHGTRPTEILTTSGTQAGINNSFENTYYYFSGTNPGWRKVGGGLSTLKNDDVILPDSYFVYRQNTSSQNTLTVVGDVQVKPFATPLGTLVSNTPQDNYVAFPVAAPMTLAQSKLYESGAFAGSSSHGSRTDELLVFDSAASGQNNSPIYTYYYFTGTNPGWRRVGGGLSTVRDSDVVFQPGQGVIIRKAAQSSPTTSVVSITPPYAQ